MSKFNSDEAAKKCVTSIIYEHGHYDGDFLIPICEDIFNAGVEWKEEQIMNGAVEGKVKDFRFVREINYASAKIEFNSIPELKKGDKVCIIVLSKEDSHE